MGEEREGIPQHSVEAGVVRSSGEKVAIGLGDQTVTSVKVEAERHDHQSNGEGLAIGGLLLGLAGQVGALGCWLLERIICPGKGGNDQDVLKVKIIKGLFAIRVRRSPLFPFCLELGVQSHHVVHPKLQA